MAVLVCKNVCKSYKDKEVLKDINLTIEQGKIYGLIGRNGVGKTTLLSILTAQNSASSGEVTLDGEKVWENRKALDHICFSREINTVTALGPNNYKIKEYFKIAKTFYPNWDQQMAESLIKEFNLDLKKKICKLSKGMLSMVTIVIGLASKADITILDEPVAGLDVIARERFYKLIIEEQCNTNRTFIISTHIIDEASGIFEDTIILHDKKVLINEDTQELLERAVYITGLAEDVDKITDGVKVLSAENIGKSKAVTVLLEKGQELENSSMVVCQPVSLQNLFVAMCGKEE